MCILDEGGSGSPKLIQSCDFYCTCHNQLARGIATDDLVLLSASLQSLGRVLTTTVTGKVIGLLYNRSIVTIMILSEFNYRYCDQLYNTLRFQCGSISLTLISPNLPILVSVSLELSQ